MKMFVYFSRVRKKCRAQIRGRKNARKNVSAVDIFSCARRSLFVSHPMDHTTHIIQNVCFSLRFHKKLISLGSEWKVTKNTDPQNVFWQRRKFEQTMRVWLFWTLVNHYAILHLYPIQIQIICQLTKSHHFQYRYFRQQIHFRFLVH